MLGQAGGIQEVCHAREGAFHLPDVPQHVIQRGNNRNPCFYAGSDYQCYLDVLGAK